MMVLGRRKAAGIPFVPMKKTAQAAWVICPEVMVCINGKAVNSGFLQSSEGCSALTHVLCALSVLDLFTPPSGPVGGQPSVVWVLS